MEAQRMAGHLIRRLHQQSTQIFAERARTAGMNLTPVQFAALDAIGAYPGTDQAGIAALIAYDKATIGGVIDRLEAKGLVLRVASKRDRRAREVSLTQQGEAILTAVTPVVRDMQQDILGRLTTEESEQFLTLAAKALSAD
ncbi:MarR family transcriptional regulator [Aliiroseovarius sp.]|uniref:MarR family winged helix-turn-helix transcriptional regulator n=1 Tax=Aliiroseovarius sp. TaxID=1872442 RepID=UPI002637FFD7|nr:MarR family transcriptional regulator [Aliiroseovarius sp.]